MKRVDSYEPSASAYFSKMLKNDSEWNSMTGTKGKIPAGIQAMRKIHDEDPENYKQLKKLAYNKVVEGAHRQKIGKYRSEKLDLFYRAVLGGRDFYSFREEYKGLIDGAAAQSGSKADFYAHINNDDNWPQGVPRAIRQMRNVHEADYYSFNKIKKIAKASLDASPSEAESKGDATESKVNQAGLFQNKSLDPELSRICEAVASSGDFLGTMVGIDGVGSDEDLSDEVSPAP
jgi:hypothetical protein